jgi:hypothetical protein
MCGANKYHQLLRGNIWGSSPFGPMTPPPPLPAIITPPPAPGEQGAKPVDLSALQAANAMAQGQSTDLTKGTAAPTAAGIGRSNLLG